MSGENLLDFLASQVNSRAALSAALGADPARSHVYYLCPLSTLRKIAAGGILPHASAPKGRADVSGAGVQARREIRLLLGWGRERSLHDCINFFWNPLNKTAWAFQRQALMIEETSKDPDDGIICILEIELDPLVKEATCHWATSSGNLAQYGFASFSRKQYGGTTKNANGELRYNWPEIFSTDQASEAPYANSRRSAEFVVSIAGDDVDRPSDPLPFHHVGRILLPDQSIRPLTPEQGAFVQGLGKQLSWLSSNGAVQIFYRPLDLLQHERFFLDSAHRRRESDAQVFAKLQATCEALTQFESAHPGLVPKLSKFASREAAYGHHGAAHAARVMLWAAFIAQDLPDVDKPRMIFPLLAAAALHDARRTTDAAEDTIHGGAAAQAFEAEVRAAFPDVGMANSCLSAMKEHCLLDENCAHKDPLWRILKDADALDRGRFGYPGGEGGCDTMQLRDPLFKTDLNGNLAWMAYRLARMTTYLKTDETPCANLVSAILTGSQAFKRWNS